MARQTVLKQSVIKMVKSYASLLKEAGVSYDKLIIFGSQVKGTAKPWSDIDLCVVSRSFKGKFDDRLKLMNIRNDRTLDIEPHPMSPSDLAEKWDPLAAEIRKTGIIVKA